MIQKNNKITYIYFYLCWRGGKINRPGQLAPGGEDNQGGGQDIPGQLAPPGASCPGGQDKLLHREISCFINSINPNHEG